jgi:hypothetical protein
MKSNIGVRAECEAQLPGERNESYYCPAPVRSWPTPPLALCSVTDVLDLRANTRDSRRRGAAGTGYACGNGSCAGCCGRNPKDWRAFHRSATNSHRLSRSLITAKCRVQRWNYESACTWDIFLLAAPGEMLDRLRKSREWPSKNTSTTCMCEFCG